MLEQNPQILQPLSVDITGTERFVLQLDFNTTTVGQLKNLIQQRHHHNPDAPNSNLVLLYAGKMLNENNKTLKSYGLKKDNTVKAMYK